MARKRFTPEQIVAVRREAERGAGRRPMASRANEVWSYDFIHDSPECGQRFKIFTVPVE
jgi:hypothetical protein